MKRHVDLRRGSYRDSVRLMQISQALQAVPGVSAALVAMATELNLELAAGMGFAPPEAAGPNDMVVAVAADDDSALAEALRHLDGELADVPTAPVSGFGAPPAPRTVGSAVRRSGADLVLVSTPGRYAFLDAIDALEAGASVMLFSDTVPVEQEVRLKDAAAEPGLLMMGPVGLVAASGTGAQQVMSLLDAADVGVSHCLGVGGRDLSSTVDGRGTLAALDALDADAATELIVVVSKPSAAEVASRVRSHAARLSTPVVFALLGESAPDLTAAVEEVLRVLGRPAVTPWPRWLPAASPLARAGTVHGLFAGGTLCDEARLIAAGAGVAHTMVDFGDDRLTAGRPQPMIDGSLRIEALAREPAGVVLLDVVLGHAADPDPAAALAPALAAAGERGVLGVVSLIGTAGDPQGMPRQAAALCEAGAAVFASNAEAARYAVGLARSAA